MPSRTSPGRTGRRRLAGLLAGRARTWGLMVPLHLVAFLALYVATLQLLQSTFVEATSQVPKLALRRVIDQLDDIARVRQSAPGPKHFFDLLSQAHQALDLKVYNMRGQPITGGDVPGNDAEHLADFLARNEPERYWLERVQGGFRMRGLTLIPADARCATCHELGEPLAVASVNMNITREMVDLRGRTRRNVGIVIAAWVALLGALSVVVKRSVERSARHLEEDLEAAAAGRPGSTDSVSGFVLDPGSRELHQALRRILERHRERQVEVATRLEHTAQLASLGQLAAGLAHEIKNPLAGIQGALEILREDAVDDTARGLCREMLGELDRVNQTLGLLLASARPSAPQRVKADVRELLGETHRLLEPTLRRRGATLKLALAPGRIHGRFDPGKIRQVLINLINNAAESMEEGGEIVIHGSRFPDGRGVILTVRDDGPGIAEETLEKVFEPFFTTKFTGTGLGLAICRSLVEQHGGTLEVESTLGEGSTFYVLLPDDGEPRSLAGETAEAAPAAGTDAAQ